MQTTENKRREKYNILDIEIKNRMKKPNQCKLVQDNI